MSLIALFAETVYGPNPEWSAERDAGEHTIAGDEGWKKAFDILTDVVYKYCDPDTAYNQSYEDCAALIANGQVAFYGNDSWALSGIRASGKFTPYGDRVLRSVFTDKLWETFSYYVLGESDWETLAADLDTYWDKARDEAVVN